MEEFIMKNYLQQNLRQDLILAVKEQAQEKMDFLVDISNTTSVTYDQATDSVRLVVGGSDFSLNTDHHYLMSLISGMNLPKETLRTMMNVNPKATIEVLKDALTKNGKTKMLRTLSGEIRGVVSPRYSRVNHEQLLPILENPSLVVKSYSLTDTGLRVSMICPELTEKLGVGEEFSCGIQLVNDETGHYQLQIRPYIERLICTNGATAKTSIDGAVNLRHIQGKPEILLSEPTKLLPAPEEFNLGKVDLDQINNTLGSTISSIKDRIQDNKLVTMTEAEYFLKLQKFNKVETEKVLQSFASAPDTESGTAWALINSVSMLGRDTNQFDRRMQIESIVFDLYQMGIATRR